MVFRSFEVQGSQPFTGVDLWSCWSVDNEEFIFILAMAWVRQRLGKRPVKMVEQVKIECQQGLLKVNL